MKITTGNKDRQKRKFAATFFYANRDLPPSKKILLDAFIAPEFMDFDSSNSSLSVITSARTDSSLSVNISARTNSSLSDDNAMRAESPDLSSAPIILNHDLSSSTSVLFKQEVNAGHFIFIDSEMDLDEDAELASIFRECNVNTPARFK